MEGFHRDDEGDWVAHLECGHSQHVRHRPPFQERRWVLEAQDRAARLGSPLECPLCDRAEMPDGLELVRSGEVWDEGSIPPRLRREHRLGPRIWGLLHVLGGRLRFAPEQSTWAAGAGQLAAGDRQAIPPQMSHHIETDGPVSVRIDFYRVPPPAAPPGSEGGESACYANRVCAGCGALLDRPGAHRSGCPAAVTL